MINQYREETENKIIDKIENLCNELPKIVTRFERSIQQYTEVKTRYAFFIVINKIIVFRNCIF